MNGFGSSLCSSRKRSGPKHRCCNVHNELAYDDTAQGPLSQPPAPSARRATITSANLVQMNLTSNGVMRSLRAPTCGTSLPSARHYARPDSFLASATRALPLPDRPNMCRPPISAASSRAPRLSSSLKPTSPSSLASMRGLISRLSRAQLSDTEREIKA
jgi:hypothetical protein